MRVLIFSVACCEYFCCVDGHALHKKNRMSSCIWFKLKGSSNFEALSFTGAGISVREATDLIMQKKKLLSTLLLVNVETGETYLNPDLILRKNSSFIIKRAVAKAPTLRPEPAALAQDEAEKKAIKEVCPPPLWRPAELPRYICYRCRRPGHYLRNCPTNGDSAFDKPRQRVTRNIAIPSNCKIVLRSKDVSVRELVLCPLCNQKLTSPMKTPCCSVTFCEECIKQYLTESNLICPCCREAGVEIGHLLSNDKLRTPRIPAH